MDRWVQFKAVVRGFGRVKVPRKVRWQYKMEPTQTIKVSLRANCVPSFTENFLGNIRKDGYITIPATIQGLMKQERVEPEGAYVEITLEPA